MAEFRICSGRINLGVAELFLRRSRISVQLELFSFRAEAEFQFSWNYFFPGPKPNFGFSRNFWFSLPFTCFHFLSLSVHYDAKS